MPKDVTAVDIDGKTYKVPVSELTWRPAAYGIVIKDEAVLLSPQFGNKHDLPGGGMDLGEFPEKAVVREVKEETGLDVTNPRLVGTHSNFFKFTHSDNSTAQSLMLYYVCDFVGGELSTEGFDKEEKEYAKIAEWVPLEKLDSIKLASSFDFREFIKKAVA